MGLELEPYLLVPSRLATAEKVDLLACGTSLLFFLTLYLWDIPSPRRRSFGDRGEPRRVGNHSIGWPEIRRTYIRNAASHVTNCVLSYCHQIRSSIIIDQISPRSPRSLSIPLPPSLSHILHNAHFPLLRHMQQDLCNSNGDEIPLQIQAAPFGLSIRLWALWPCLRAPGRFAICL